jgi:sec-independent protein translocase protein TatA
LGWPELIIILVIILFIFGASRIKGITRALGEAISEFKRATQEKPKEEVDDDIISAAKKMGINTEGKTQKQILDEMSQKAENA